MPMPFRPVKHAPPVNIRLRALPNAQPARQVSMRLPVRPHVRLVRQVHILVRAPEAAQTAPKVHTTHKQAKRLARSAPQVHILMPKAQRPMLVQSAIKATTRAKVLRLVRLARQVLMRRIPVR